MKSKGIGSLLLTGLLLLSLLAGCGNAESETASVSEPPVVSAEPAEETPEAEPVTEPDISSTEPLEETTKLSENLTLPLAEDLTTLTMFTSEVNLMGPHGVPWIYGLQRLCIYAGTGGSEQRPHRFHLCVFFHIW